MFISHWSSCKIKCCLSCANKHFSNSGNEKKIYLEKYKLKSMKLSKSRFKFRIIDKEVKRFRLVICLLASNKIEIKHLICF